MKKFIITTILLLSMTATCGAQEATSPDCQDGRCPAPIVQEGKFSQFYRRSLFKRFLEFQNTVAIKLIGQHDISSDDGSRPRSIQLLIRVDGTDDYEVIIEQKNGQQSYRLRLLESDNLPSTDSTIPTLPAETDDTIDRKK